MDTALRYEKPVGLSHPMSQAPSVRYCDQHGSLACLFWSPLSLRTRLDVKLTGLAMDMKEEEPPQSVSVGSESCFPILVAWRLKAFTPLRQWQ